MIKISGQEGMQVIILDFLPTIVHTFTFFTYHI